MDEKLLITMNASDLRNLIGEVLEEKLKPIDTQKVTETKEDELYSRLYVAKLFGVSVTTIDKWRNFKILPPDIKIASRVYFNKAKILAMLKSDFNYGSSNKLKYD
jgi:predicted DNA-binding transcriptional regulator AlpA